MKNGLTKVILSLSIIAITAGLAGCGPRGNLTIAEKRQVIMDMEKETLERLEIGTLGLSHLNQNMSECFNDLGKKYHTISWSINIQTFIQVIILIIILSVIFGLIKIT